MKLNINKHWKFLAIILSVVIALYTYSYLSVDTKNSVKIAEAYISSSKDLKNMFGSNYNWRLLKTTTFKKQETRTLQLSYVLKANSRKGYLYAIFLNTNDNWVFNEAIIFDEEQNRIQLDINNI